jgi:hypothetical protein
VIPALGAVFVLAYYLVYTIGVLGAVVVFVLGVLGVIAWALVTDRHGSPTCWEPRKGETVIRKRTGDRLRVVHVGLAGQRVATIGVFGHLKGVTETYHSTALRYPRLTEERAWADLWRGIAARRTDQYMADPTEAREVDAQEALDRLNEAEHRVWSLDGTFPVVTHP